MWATNITPSSTFKAAANERRRDFRTNKCDVLYLNDENVVRTGRLFKTYVEAAFSKNSTEWNHVKGLGFIKFDRK